MEDHPTSDANPTKHLEEALKRWGKAADDRDEFSLSEIDMLETVKLIGSLGNGKAFGHDELDAISLKLVAPSIYLPIQHLVNLSIRSSRFASRWKLGRLIPLHKGKGLDRLSMNLYRPISLLPVVSKNC